MTVLAVIQARMTSTRLPGKVLADMNGRPLLAYMIARARRAAHLSRITVATTDRVTDDPVDDLCKVLGVPVFRGDEADVLGRFVGAAQNAETIVRLTADCPLIDPDLIDEAILQFHEGGFDYLSNAMERSYPDGLDVEVFSNAALKQAHAEAILPFHREHVTPYMRTGHYRDIPTGAFKVGHLLAPSDFSHLRWTVDTADDLERIRGIAGALPDNHGWMDALSLVTRRPELLRQTVRVAQAVQLCDVTPLDADILFDWVNRPDSLANKLRTEGPVKRAGHDAWLAGKLASERTGLWIARLDGQPAGQVRLELKDNALEVDIYVDPAYRSRGIAVAMLEAARVKAGTRWPGVPLLARIKPENWPSRRLFVRAGYGRMAVAQDHVILHRAAAVPAGVAA